MARLDNMKLSAPVVAVLAVLGVLVTAGISFTVERVTTERALLSDASSGSLSDLAPNGRPSQMDQPDAEHPVVGSVGPDGKITIEKGAPGAGGDATAGGQISSSRVRDD